MGIEISIQEDYILVEPPNGIDYWEILEGVGRLMNMDGYRRKNVIWEFRDGPVMLVYDDLYKITKIVKEHNSQNAIRNRTAILVETGFQRGMADEFVKIAKDLPCDIGIFSDMRSAQDWITG
jgi:hypothetical protein